MSGSIITHTAKDGRTTWRDACALMMHPKVVSERLGQADIGMTLRTYSPVLPQMHQQAAEVFAAAMAEQDRA